MLPPPGSHQPPPRTPRDHDEWIAVLVALGFLGGTAGWFITGGFTGLDWRSTRLPSSPVMTPPAADSAVTVSPSSTTNEIGETVTPDTLPDGDEPPTELEIDGGQGDRPETAASPQTIEPSSEGAVTVPNPQIPDSQESSNLPTVRAALTFTDVPADYWAKPYIDTLTARGVLDGLPEGTFAPDRPLTRAEFAAQIAKAFDLQPVQTSASFVDVPADYWAAPAIEQSVAMGFLKGYPQGTFQPNQTVTRLQVIVALATGLALRPTANAEESLQQYTDQTAIPAWAKEKVAAAIAADILSATPDSTRQLRPNEPATRAEVAALMYRALAYLGSVEPVREDEQS